MQVSIAGSMSIVVAVLAFAGFSGPAYAGVQEPYPLEYFALREVVRDVTISPDGKRVAMLKILSRDGDPELHIHNAGDLDADPFVVNADPMEIFAYQWASDEHVVMIVRQRVRDKVKRQEQSVFEYRLVVLDVVDEEFKELNAAWPQFENMLPGKPNKVIISEQPGAEPTMSLREAFRPRAYYELDLERGTKKLLIRGKIDMGQFTFDSDGNPRMGFGFDVGEREYVLYYRDPGEKKWNDAWRMSEDDFELWQMQPLQLDDAQPGNMLIRAFNGDDKLGLWSYNMKAKKYDELLYRRSDVDVVDVVMHSN